MSPSLLLFFSAAVLLCLVISIIVILPWMRTRAPSDNRLMSVNVAVFEQRIAELNDDKATGLINDETHQAQIIELKRQLLEAQTKSEISTPVGRKGRLIVIIWVLILSAMAYLLVADRTSVFKLWEAQDTVGQVADDLLTGKISTPPEWAAKDSMALISAMQTNVHRHAYDADRWIRLSELFGMIDAKSQAVEAVSRAYRLQPDNIDIAMRYVQTRFFAANGVLDAQGFDAVQGVLAKQPAHEGAMMMMAMGEARARNFDAARQWIGRLRENIATKSGDRSEALSSLDSLLAHIDQQEHQDQQGVEVSITVDEQLMPKLNSGSVLFIAISEVAGGPPYAAKRLPISELQQGETQVTLSDLDAVMPERTLSLARQNGAKLKLTAHISSSGDAVTKSGDLSANPVILTIAQKSAKIHIARIVP
ncbi:c-type cytochrome biogenesis protein CcmI [Moraxella nasovis]|uniref:c-type cytochrome biogenesis protein CcmI n=1 Tax=Moraxella nasovis TaxID=2904121 RepID=UPI001F60C88E|nr:c-type cytochrome biogenesis protein CcmI [Moraxella nasovis]UNU73085.1 c-type cytochrome biogenesis protein CcmI [Moraxella nasovis]